MQGSATFNLPLWWRKWERNKGREGSVKNKEWCNLSESQNVKVEQNANRQFSAWTVNLRLQRSLGAAQCPTYTPTPINSGSLEQETSGFPNGSQLIPICNQNWKPLEQPLGDCWRPLPVSLLMEGVPNCSRDLWLCWLVASYFQILFNPPFPGESSPGISLSLNAFAQQSSPSPQAIRFQCTILLSSHLHLVIEAAKTVARNNLHIFKSTNVIEQLVKW